MSILVFIRKSCLVGFCIIPCSCIFVLRLVILKFLPFEPIEGCGSYDLFLFLGVSHTVVHPCVRMGVPDGICINTSHLFSCV